MNIVAPWNPLHRNIAPLLAVQKPMTLVDGCSCRVNCPHHWSIGLYQSPPTRKTYRMPVHWLRRKHKHFVSMIPSPLFCSWIHNSKFTSTKKVLESNGLRVASNCWKHIEIWLTDAEDSRLHQRRQSLKVACLSTEICQSSLLTWLHASICRQSQAWCVKFLSNYL